MSKVTVNELKAIFEQIVNDTPKLKKDYPIAPATDQHYWHENTNDLFKGFAIGVRYSERIRSQMRIQGVDDA